MKKFMILAAASAMAITFSSCDDCDNCNIDRTYAEVATADELQGALDNGVREIVLTDPLTTSETFTIPNSYASGDELVLEIPADGNDVTFNQSLSNTRALPTLSATVTDADNVTINTPDMTVNFSGDVDGLLTATTAANTLNILDGSQIYQLRVLKGNVYIYGDVDGITNVAAGSKIIWAVSNATELTAQLAKDPVSTYNNGVVLTANISYTETASNISAAFSVGSVSSKSNAETAYDADSYSGYIFDGNGKTLSGLASQNVLGVYANSAVIKNLTVEQIASQTQTNNGIHVFRCDSVFIENVTVRNCGKAGLIVNSSIVAASKFNASDNSWGSVNLGGGLRPFMAPAFDFNGGTLAGVSVANSEGPYKIYIDTDEVPEGYTVKTPAGQTWATSTNPADTTQTYYYRQN